MVPPPIGEAARRIEPPFDRDGPAARRYLDMDAKVDRSRVVPPGIRGDCESRHEPRSRWRARAIVNGACRMAEQRVHGFVADTHRSNPADRRKVLRLIRALGDRGDEPERKGPMQEVPDRSASGGRCGRRRDRAEEAHRRPHGMPNREQDAHGTRTDPQVQPPARRAFHEGERVVQAAAFLLERCQLRPLGGKAHRQRVMEPCGLRQRRLGVRSARAVHHPRAHAPASSRRPLRMASSRRRSARPVTSGFQSLSTSRRAIRPRSAAAAGFAVTSRTSVAAWSTSGSAHTEPRRSRAVVACQGHERVVEQVAVSGVMKSMLPEYAVPIKGFPRLIASSSVSPNPSERCGER